MMTLLHRLAISRRSWIAFSSLALVATSLWITGCRRSRPSSPSVSPAAEAPAPAPPTAEPAVVFANGFKYHPEETTPGYPDVTTIRLGNRLRIYSIGSDWTPATLALLDSENEVRWSIRLDLPPKGTVTGSLPEGLEPASFRLIQGVGKFDASKVQRRIGMNEPEWSTERMKELGVFPLDEATSAADPKHSTSTSWSGATSAHESGMDPNFGRVYAIKISPDTHTTSEMSATANEWTPTETAPDDFWLTETVRRWFDEHLPAKPR